jgi:hypothetical protein
LPLSRRTAPRTKNEPSRAISRGSAFRKEGRPERTAIASSTFVFPAPFSPEKSVIPGAKEKGTEPRLRKPAEVKLSSKSQSLIGITT